MSPVLVTELLQDRCCGVEVGWMATKRACARLHTSRVEQKHATAIKAVKRALGVQRYESWTGCMDNSLHRAICRTNLRAHGERRLMETRGNDALRL